MVHAIAALLVFQLVGEVLVQALALPLPGPLLGMLLLFAAFVVRGGVPEAVERGAQALLSHLMLLFIPAVTGVILYAERIGREWLPFLAACLIGAAITMAAAAYTLRWMLRITGQTAAERGDGTAGAADRDDGDA